MLCVNAIQNKFLFKQIHLVSPVKFLGAREKWHLVTTSEMQGSTDSCWAVHIKDFGTHLLYRSWNRSTTVVLPSLSMLSPTLLVSAFELIWLWPQFFNYSHSEGFLIFLHFLMSLNQKVFALGGFAQARVHRPHVESFPHIAPSAVNRTDRSDAVATETFLSHQWKF